ncbi:MAG: hypothetical protein J0L61_08935 [Planctomycetes bacterium]|nr:hypothetical protein [Planctomycetota bacterium]
MVDTADLVIFLGAFGGACPITTEGGEEQQLRAGASAPFGAEVPVPHASPVASGCAAPFPPVLAALGFASESEYLAYVEGLDVPSRDAHAALLTATIKALGLE